METIDIVNLIENNPITKLSNDYNNKLLHKIKTEFTNMEQQLFLTSFYCYLNYHPTNDFVIDLDNVWKWLGFSTKQKGLILLNKHFITNIDYINSLNLKDKQDVKKHGGQNREIIMLNIRTFKLFCILAETQKANEIHKYFIKLEELLHEILQEESIELKLQLQQKENTIIEKQREVEQALISQFPVNTECIYFGKIDNTNEEKEKLIKFGHTNDLSVRVSHHHKHYDNFTLKHAFRVQNKVEIENLIKSDPKIKKQIRTIQINGKNKTELIAYNDNFTIEKITKIIKDIIHSRIYSLENFNKLISRNEELEKENYFLKDKVFNLEKEISNKNIELLNTHDKLQEYKNKCDTISKEEEKEDIIYQNILLPQDEINKKFNDFIIDSCIVRHDVEELSVNLEGRYRLYNKIKPTKEIFHAFKNYLDTRFKAKRIDGRHGYIGIKLKQIEYKKTKEISTVETFIFQVCQFSDCGKILNSVLLREFQKWKVSVGKELSENDLKEIKDYLNNSPYTVKATVWTDEGNNEGYYGISLKQNEYKPKLVSSTGKKVYKREKVTNQLLATFETIAKAAYSEGISAAKMSRSVKNNTIINDYYYSTS
jgi:phage anti-repressor protein/uncharacterized protein YpuA (DUF1002 family)